MRKIYLKMTVFALSALTGFCGKTFAQSSPTLTVATNKTSIAEHESVTITATLSAPLANDIYIPFQSKGTALIGGDFSTNGVTVIKTVAGGNGYGSAANQLSNPSSVYVDTSGIYL